MTSPRKIQVGAVHAGKIVDVALDHHIVTIYDGQVAVAAVPAAAPPS